MTPEVISFFKGFCSNHKIEAKDSKLGEEVLRLDEIDFWSLLKKEEKQMGAPILNMEVGSSFVVHFHFGEKDYEFMIEVIPNTKSGFRELLEDYTRNAS